MITIETRTLSRGGLGVREKERQRDHEIVELMGVYVLSVNITPIDLSYDADANIISFNTPITITNIFNDSFNGFPNNIHAQMHNTYLIH